MTWKLALAQHPMYLIIREDTQCAERTPPWGESTIEGYVERIRENLATLRKYPQLKLGYEWSGVEVELLAQDAPDVFREMCDLAKKGQTTFYNGTYAQPHLQILSSEANYRQFEFGMRIYRELCDWQVKTYLHQEASVHDQVPQLLNAFGIEYGVTPQFSSTIAWLEETEIVMLSRQGPRFTQGNEFATWTGLDGSEIYLYLRVPLDKSLEDLVANEAIAGRQRVPSIIVDVPDLVKVDEDWLARHEQFDFVLLDEALETALKKKPPRARFYSNWSYIEGIRVEELSRTNRRAETSVLQAEALNALAFALVNRPVDSTDELWKTILKTQHHDVYCFCAPELKGKAIGWLQQVEQEAEAMSREAMAAIASQVNCDDGDGQAIIVFNATPHHQTNLVTFEVPVENPVITNKQGDVLPSDIVSTADGSNQVCFLADTSGLGYETYWVRLGGQTPKEASQSEPFTFDNEQYQATVQPNGTFTSLVLKSLNAELLATATIHGNQLAAMDSTGLSPWRPGMAPREDWQPPKAGPQLNWQPAESPRLRHSALGTVFTLDGQMGDKITGQLRLSFYHHLPRIDLSWTFTFDTATIGTFYDDDSKLRVQWPLAFAGDIQHDIAFGAIKTRTEWPFFPANWVDISDGEKGLAYFHQGTPKHWVTEDGVLVNLFAWGENTEAIGSRMWRYNWPKAFDQRLRGQHTIRCALFPHQGDWRTADVPNVASSYQSPPLAYLTERHVGSLPDQVSIFSIAEPEVIATAVKVEDEQLFCRLYSMAPEAVAVKANSAHFQTQELVALSGEEVTQLNPFQIGQLRLKS